jgi:hypothetical protein
MNEAALTQEAPIGAAGGGGGCGVEDVTRGAPITLTLSSADQVTHVTVGSTSCQPQKIARNEPTAIEGSNESKSH